MDLPVEIEVWRGEIAELEVDALVVPANESLFMTSPVAAAVKRRAGDEVEREAVALGPVVAGGAVVTSGGRLAAPYLIHAVAVGHDLQPDPDRLRSAVDAALDAIRHLALRRVAFAPLGTERGTFSSAEAARLLLEQLASHDGAGSGLPEQVVIAVSRAEELADYRAAIDALAARPQPMPAEG